jgi:glycosyltransferase involved in cell wall biosynthesis
VKLSVVLTHPIQYYAPWFRHIARNCPELDLTVLYATMPTPEQQGVGFGVPFTWDSSVTEGYQFRIVCDNHKATDVSSRKFWGVDARGIGYAIEESSPDVVLLPGWHSATYLRALYFCRSRGIPLLFRGDTHLGNRPPGWKGHLWDARTRLLLRAFDGYLAVGSRVREYLKNFEISETRIIDCPHCIDNELFAGQVAPYKSSAARSQLRQSLGIGVNEFVTLFVGKLDKNKRPSDLVHAAAELGAGICVLMVGAGELGDTLQAEARNLNVRLVATGFMNQSQLGTAYASADCLVLPSFVETWGLVVNEVMSTGLPCVVSDRVGCAPDLVKSGETGEVFRMGDVADLAAALERVRQKTERGYDWNAACRARASLFSFEAATRGLVAGCRKVRKKSSVPRTRVLACCGHMVIVAGLERMTFEVLRVLRERDIPVHCVVNSWENHRIVALAEQIGASWSRGRYMATLDRHTRNPAKVFSAFSDILVTSSGLLRDCWRFRPTHVLLPEFLAALRNAPALVILRILGVKVVLRLGNPPIPGPFYEFIWKRVIDRLVNAFVCNSRFTEKELLAYGVPTRKVSYVYNTVPSRRNSSSNRFEHDWRKIIFVGQLIPEKGAHVLLDAVALLVTKAWDVTLDVVGDIEGWEPPSFKGYHQSLVRRASEPDLAGRVNFLGYREDVHSLLAQAGIHCCPSQPEQREGFGVVVLEAKMAGIPSVVTPTGALPELIQQGRDGWVCSDVSAGALAEGIEKFLVDAALTETAGKTAFLSLERFDRKSFAQGWWRIFSGQDCTLRDRSTQRVTLDGTVANVDCDARRNQPSR